jgi:hypothetical protein
LLQGVEDAQIDTVELFHAPNFPLRSHDFSDINLLKSRPL